MSTVASVGLAMCMFMAAFVSFRCTTPPNPPPAKPEVNDRIGRIATQSKLHFRRNLLLLMWLYHILLTFTYPNVPPTICPHPDRLDPKLFSWSTLTVTTIAITLIAGGIRLTAYKQLGENFTFQLAKPKALVKHGLYSYMQHPSYTGQWAVLAANFLLISRRAGAVSCWLPGLLDIKYLGALGWTAMLGPAIIILGVRIRDEEIMLKREFGKEWEEYHARTKRLIPGLL